MSESNNQLAAQSPAQSYEPPLDELHPHEALRSLFGQILMGFHDPEIDDFREIEAFLDLLLEFYPDGDNTQNPPLNNQRTVRFILIKTGWCLMALRRLREAPSFYERGIVTAAELIEPYVAVEDYELLGHLYGSLGELDKSLGSFQKALELTQQPDHESARWLELEISSLVDLAWTEHQRGEMVAASAHFQTAETHVQKLDPKTHRPRSLGVPYADHLRRMGIFDRARRVIESFQEWAERRGYPGSLSKVHRALGDLEADCGNHQTAGDHYEQALDHARNDRFKDSELMVLLTRGRWLAKYMNDPGAAFSHLDEALAYFVETGLRICEADTRVALTWAHYRAGDLDKAQEQANHAMTMIQEMGYHWGQVDADEVIGEIKLAS